MSLLEGKLLQVGEAGIMLELPPGPTFVPLAAILYVRLPEGRQASSFGPIQQILSDEKAPHR